MQVAEVIISSYLLRNTSDVLTAKYKGLCQKTLTLKRWREKQEKETAEIGENTQYIYIQVKSLPFQLLCSLPGLMPLRVCLEFTEVKNLASSKQ